MVLKTGIVGTSRKENEQRVAIHPEQFEQVPGELRSHLVFEKGYGAPFGVSDEQVEEVFGGGASREEILGSFDVVVLPKPVQEDFEQLREEAVLWGWPHCVQQKGFTQTSIERRLTLIAWEAMFHWTRNGQRDLHTFYRNNEMAGYCGVLDALRLTGFDGYYGPPRKVVVLSFGSVSRGAIHALLGRGLFDITVYTQRPPHLVRDQVLGCQYGQMFRGDDGRVHIVEPDGTEKPLVDVLAATDVIVNGILQDTDRPFHYVTEAEIDRLKPGSLIVDVSCDLAMGFPFARPTSFEDPVFEVGAQVTYYAVDHTPTYLWKSASWELSSAVIPYLPTVMGGPEAWQEDETVRRSIEIQDGVVLNPKILSFQHREEEYPHRVRA